MVKGGSEIMKPAYHRHQKIAEIWPIKYTKIGVRQTDRQTDKQTNSKTMKWQLWLEIYIASSS
jgi:hypothetical protein